MQTTSPGPPHERSSPVPETDPERGLSVAEAERRLAEQGSWAGPPTSRSYRSIVRANVFTVFNLILGVMGLLAILLVDWRDALFLGVVVANTLIGIAQEVRAKRTLDGLAALVAPTATVVRDGDEREVGVGSIVVGDLIRLGTGDQVTADGELVAGHGLTLDESALTGESEPVARQPGDEIRSGTFVAEGSGALVATAVGPNAYAERLAGAARRYRNESSPLQRAINRVLLTFAAVATPLTALLLLSLSLRDVSLSSGTATLVAGVVALVPEGLVLLTSITYAAAATKIARRGALSQQLNAIESLASVDVFCVDKTGTLTENALRLVETIPAAGIDGDDLRSELARFAASADAANATLRAVGAGLDPSEPATVRGRVPFSSRWRWSALATDDGAWAIGAPEAFALDADGPDGRPLSAHRTAAADAGRRVLAFVRLEGTDAAALERLDPADGPPPGARLAGLVVLAEQLRPNIGEAIAFLQEQDVAIRVLSGDAPRTVGAIARDTGIVGAEDPLDGTDLPEDDDELGALLARRAVVGRISPEGKERVVRALRARGNYVAMIGDGVNDVPALKAAQLAIAQGSGAQMAKSVADVVLVQGDFRIVPPMVAEGRQILRNIQRVARLFVTKSVFAALFVLAVVIGAFDYPMLPRHLSVASTLTIGVPAFFLALAPSSGPWRPDRFLTQIGRFALPAGLGVAVGVLAAYLVALKAIDDSLAQARTVSTMVMIGTSLFVVARLELGDGRLAGWVVGLLATMVAAYAVLIALPVGRRFFELSVPDGTMLGLTAGGLVLGIAVVELGLRAVARWGPGAAAPATGDGA